MFSYADDDELDEDTLAIPSLRDKLSPRCRSGMVHKSSDVHVTMRLSYLQCYTCDMPSCNSEESIHNSISSMSTY